MKSQDLKKSSDKRGVSRLWLGVAAVVGAAGAYLADPERGGARRDAAVRQVSTAAKTATERVSHWREAVSTRLSRSGEDKLPKQVTVPVHAGGTVTVKPPSTNVPNPVEAVKPSSPEISAESKKTAETKKTGA